MWTNKLKYLGMGLPVFHKIGIAQLQIWEFESHV